MPSRQGARFGLIVAILSFGAHLTNVLYLVLNWQNGFIKSGLRIAALVFMGAELLCNIVATIILMTLLKAFRRMDDMKMVAMFALAGIIPAFSLVFIIVYFNFLAMVFLLGGLSQLVNDGWSNKTDEAIKVIHFTQYSQLFLSALPLLIIQSLNNTQSDNWDVLAIICFIFNSFISMVGVIKFMFCDSQCLDYKSSP